MLIEFPREYSCPVCGQSFRRKTDADKCASKPVEKDMGARVGDWVLILEGKHKGLRARVDRVYVMKGGKLWWMFDRYWHTVAIEASIPPYARQGYGEAKHVVLAFDEYGLGRPGKAGFVR